MKIYMPHDSRSGQTGGGTTFTRNLKAGVSKDVVFVENMESADLLFIAGSTLCEKDTAREAHIKGKPIVLRIDNIAEDHRNRGTGISRMRLFANMASIVVFQSEWSRHVTAPIVGGNGTVIYNGVDTDLFHPPEKTKEHPPTFIYVKYSRNECKRYEEAQTLFREYARKQKDARFIIVGRYAEELQVYNMGFWNNENIDYRGVLNPEQLAEAYREADVMLFPSFGDSCPNVVLEAMASGLVVGFNGWGGTEELVGAQGIQLNYTSPESAEMNMTHLMRHARDKEYWKVDPRKHVMDRFTLKRMCEEYEGVFRLALLNPQPVGGKV